MSSAATDQIGIDELWTAKRQNEPDNFRAKCKCVIIKEDLNPAPDDRLPDKRFIDDLRAVCEKHGVVLKTPWENGDRYYFMSEPGRFSVPIDGQFNREVLRRE